jgi:hypothetical protein
MLALWTCYCYRTYEVDIKQSRGQPPLPKATVPPSSIPDNVREVTRGIGVRVDETFVQGATVRQPEEQALPTTGAPITGILHPHVGPTLVLAGKCRSPDYGIRFYYVRTKHTLDISGILRRVGHLHEMVVADPPAGSTIFKTESDFHRVAQGRCIDFMAAYVARASWLDKAFRGGLRFAAVADPTTRAIVAFDHAKTCGTSCGMCRNNIQDAVKWAKMCSGVHDAQYELLRGSSEDITDVVANYDLLIVSDRCAESLVVLRHVLGVALTEMLSIGKFGPVKVPLSSRPARFLDVIASKNSFDRKLYEAANVTTFLWHHDAKEIR